MRALQAHRARSCHRVVPGAARYALVGCVLDSVELIQHERQSVASWLVVRRDSDSRPSIPTTGTWLGRDFFWKMYQEDCMRWRFFGTAK
jgi:hypothetical protein